MSLKEVTVADKASSLLHFLLGNLVSPEREQFSTSVYDNNARQIARIDEPSDNTNIYHGKFVIFNENRTIKTITHSVIDLLASLGACSVSYTTSSF